MARKFGRVFRFIDDLLAINDGNEFEKHYREIYPPELELKKENVTNIQTSFLELDIQLSNHSFSTKLYDKRDAFGFHISHLPYKDSNIPHRMFYSSASAEVLGICRATPFLPDVTASVICRATSFLPYVTASVRSLINRMLTQGANEDSLKKSFRKSLNKHQIPFTKFNTTTDSMINNFF